MRATRYSHEGQLITASMLRTLYDMGPGGLIIAEDITAPFTLIHARDLDLKCPDLVIIYGHGDLIHELADGHQAWDQVAAHATDTASPEHDLRSSRALSTPLRHLREHMRAQGMNLTHRPVFDRTQEQGIHVEDLYAFRSNPDLTIGASCARAPGGRLLVQTRMFDQGRPVSISPACFLSSGGGSDLATETGTQAANYLARTR